MESEISQINNSALRLLMPLTPEETYKTIVDEAIKITGAAYGTIVLDQQDEMVQVYSSENINPQSKVRRRANTYKSYTEREILVIPVEKLIRAHPELIADQIKNSIYLPLSYQDKAIGVLIINTRNEYDLSAKAKNILSLFGAMATLAIRKTQLYAETKSALETRDSFISLASHELRTPLTSINGYIQLLNSKLKDKGTVESKWIKELYGESKRLTNLVTELIEINRIKQGQLQFHLQECSVKNFLTQLLENYSVINPEREILLDTTVQGSNAIFIGDSVKLLQVFTGLLNNADKFSPQGLQITLSVKATSSKIIFSIIDKGSGIAREDLSRIFEGFYKGENNERIGLGVGLLLAKHIIQYHHGSIQVRSKVKSGTTVEVRLPLLHRE